MQEYQQDFADFLVECGAFKLGTFTLKSGRESPTFVNTGLVKDGAGLARLGQAYAGKIVDVVGADGFDSVFGPAYKGIPIAVSTVIALSARGVVKNCLFDRKERKTHGEEASAGAAAAALLVGHRPGPGERIVLVDDVMTDGATKREAVELLRGLVPDIEIPALVIGVDREEVGKDGRAAGATFEAEVGVPVVAAVRMTELIDYLRGKGAVGDADFGRCLDYLARYGTDGAKAWAESRR